MLLRREDIPLFLMQICLWKNFSTIGQRASSGAGLLAGDAPVSRFKHFNINKLKKASA
jgi:hypothetical protein